MNTPVFDLLADSAAYDQSVECLFDQAFGPGRFAKTAQRLREGNSPERKLSRLMLRDTQVLGAAKVWPIAIGDSPALFFGPFAVDHAYRGHGLGRRLVQSCVDAAMGTGPRAMLLIGSRTFFEPLGFERVPDGRVQLPGPVDPDRLLWRALGPWTLADINGPVTI